MRAILFLLGGLVLTNIVWATFFWHAPAKDKSQPIVNPATLRGQDPWMVTEHYTVEARDNTRKSTLETLGKPWSSFCSAEGHKLLVGAIDYYYWQRSSQLAWYPKNWGEEARPYIIKVWATADDNRIERLTRETYGRGYFSLDELKLSARSSLAETLKRERVTAKPCSG
ncbi:hypothetical protein [Rhodoplanes sp. Z2-YC6860]|uniref:hypothetical protein n=1 Tax=Rhodoplanes sp. Z2-YC6860 TaxID=674703 RepID=UPI00078B4FB4|nr:hypothetical protein [Rhodoplanes sp. Z2-YC6860]AMN40112.1 hypothetical protein RHPLAN_16570 [Rhodoplanes sp. Z2-YC6860]